MESLFENSYVRDKKLFKELYSYFFFRRPAMIVCYILSLIVLIVTTLSIIFFGWSNSYILNIAVILLVLLRIPAYFHQVNSIIKRDREICVGELSVTSVVTDEYIEQTSSLGATTQMKYDNIKYGIETRNLILLRSKANLCTILPKDRFSKGNAEEFKTFMRGKGIKIR